MRLERITIRNFRLLRRASIDLASKGSTTILVGPNNSGKTSVMDALRLFTRQGSDTKKKFSIHDISHTRKTDFKCAEAKLQDAADDLACIEVLRKYAPRVRMDMVFSYGNDNADWVVASELLMNLDPANNRVAVRIEFVLDDAKWLLTDFRARRLKSENLFDFLSHSINDYYGLRFSKISEDGREAQILENGSVIERLIKIDMISAQRYMDDEDSPRSAKLSKLLHEHYNRYYRVENAEEFNSIEDLIKDIAKNLTDKYTGAFERLFKQLKNFGYPKSQLSPDLRVRAEMSAETVYRDNTFVYYATQVLNASGESETFELPEKYNGLGYKNLIYIVLQLESFRASLQAITVDQPRVHIIAIEEPEVHLHPQMQCVFIKEIGKALEQGTGPSAQVILSTHSSHMVVDSGFDPIRYFKKSGHQVMVRDLSRLKPPASEPDAITFLRRYIKLTHCDLFFADKAILVEGQVERILMPSIIQKCVDRPGCENLSSEYISILEVGGRYVHIFESLIDFIGVPTLVITDLDTVDMEGIKCPVAGAARSSNPALTKWIPAKTQLNELLMADSAVRTKRRIHITYQIAEGGNCGRSFEEAFIYANLDWLNLNHKKLLATGPAIEKSGLGANLAANAYTLTMKLPKVDFALDLIGAEGWGVPAYVIEGLDWLAAQGTAI